MTTPGWPSPYGDQEPYGDQRPRGQQGPYGDQDPGPYGQQGPYEEQGPSPYGDQGPAPYGQQGPYGNQGPGSYGNQGPRGNQGPAPYGQQGSYGDQGPGPYGQQGPGPYGNQGPRGDQGPAPYGQQGPGPYGQQRQQGSHGDQVPGPPAGQGPSGDQAPPTCFRHHDRETWVSCVRCGRHACPDCLRQAAVGQQCVECVRDADRGTRRPTTVFGGRPASSAVVTWTLIGINVVLFLVELVKPNIANDLGLLGYAQYSTGGAMQGVAAGQWYRLITSAFLPPATGLGGLGFLDILFNMWALFAVGPSLEQLLGRGRFLAVYLLSAVGGGVAFFLIGQPYVLALGASGAVFGLFGAWFVVSRRLRMDSRGIIALIVINLVFSFVYRSTIAWQDHVGGLIVGAAITAAFAYAPRKNRAVVQVAAAVAVLVILAVIVVYRTGNLTA